MLQIITASLRPKELAAPIVRFETEPGEQMQVDWTVIRRTEPGVGVRGDAGLEPRCLYRVRHRRAGRDADRGAQERLSGVGGAPQEVLYDHMRTACIERHGLRPRPTPVSSRAEQA